MFTILWFVIFTTRCCLAKIFIIVANEFSANILRYARLAKVVDFEISKMGLWDGKETWYQEVTQSKRKCRLISSLLIVGDGGYIFLNLTILYSDRIMLISILIIVSVFNGLKKTMFLGTSGIHRSSDPTRSSDKRYSRIFGSLGRVPTV